MLSRLLLLPCLALAALAAAAPAETPVPEAVNGAARAAITPGALLAPVRFLASDALEGRGPATRGDELARLYLATRLEGLGYQPAFPGGKWQQPLDVVGIKAQFPATWSFKGGKGPGFDAQWSRDYIAASGVQEAGVSVQDSELVFGRLGQPLKGWHHVVVRAEGIAVDLDFVFSQYGFRWSRLGAPVGGHTVE